MILMRQILGTLGLCAALLAGAVPTALAAPPPPAWYQELRGQARDPFYKQVFRQFRKETRVDLAGANPTNRPKMEDALLKAVSTSGDEWVKTWGLIYMGYVGSDKSADFLRAFAKEPANSQVANPGDVAVSGYALKGLAAWYRLNGKRMPPDDAALFTASVLKDAGIGQDAIEGLGEAAEPAGIAPLSRIVAATRPGGELDGWFRHRQAVKALGQIYGGPHATADERTRAAGALADTMERVGLDLDDHGAMGEAMIAMARGEKSRPTSGPALAAVEKERRRLTRAMLERLSRKDFAPGGSWAGSWDRIRGLGELASLLPRGDRLRDDVTKAFEAAFKTVAADDPDKDALKDALQALGSPAGGRPSRGVLGRLRGRP